MAEGTGGRGARAFFWAALASRSFFSRRALFWATNLSFFAFLSRTSFIAGSLAFMRGTLES